MKNKIMSLLVICFTFSLLAEGVWTKANSPYIINPEIFVVGKLTIEPGVTIILDSAIHDLYCDTLLALGSPSDSITFISNGFKVKELGLTKKGGGYAKFQYCRFKNILRFNINMKTTVFQNSSIISTMSRMDATGGNLLIENSNFENYFMNLVSIPVRISNSKLMITDSSAHAGIEMISCTTVVISNTQISGYRHRDENGSLKIIEAKTTINNCTFSNNSPGIIIMNADSSLIYNSNIQNNQGCLNVFGSSYVNIHNNNITGNRGFTLGGGIRLNNNINKAFIVNNLIANNWAQEHGGGIFTSDSTQNVDSVILAGNIIANNSANGDGGGCYLQAEHMQFINNTVTFNHSIYGGALFIRNNSSVTNSIIYGNTSQNSKHQICFDFKDSIQTFTPTIENCNIQDGKEGVKGHVYYITEQYSRIYTLTPFNGIYKNNISADPLFLKPSEGPDTTFNGVTADWRISALSPCIDKGNNSFFTPEISDLDYFGIKRIKGNSIDIGACEYNNDLVKYFNKKITFQPLALGKEQYFDLKGRREKLPNRTSKIVILRYGQEYKSSIILLKK